ncbi:MAG: hypothetical protein [Bacteriophage sp.]|jgi:hypothetical protein|nr:MAG: hypothetical protein [Bacteriophage sp.]
MSTNKFIEKLDKEWFNDIKNNFKNKDDIDRENNQTNLLKEISKTKTNIDLTRLQISRILEEDYIDIDLLITYTKQHNDLYDKLNILNSYKTIFGID